MSQVFGDIERYVASPKPARADAQERVFGKEPESLLHHQLTDGERFVSLKVPEAGPALFGAVPGGRGQTQADRYKRNREQG